MIDLSKAMLICLAYPDGYIHPSVHLYFGSRGMPIDKNIGVLNIDAPIIQVRNLIMRDYVLPRVKSNPEMEWVIFMDRDNHPKNGLTDPFLDEVDADVVGCEYPLKNKGAWCLPDSFHMGIVRMRPEIIAKVPPPWFLYEYNEDGTALKGCECSYLKKKLIDLEAKVVHRGWAEHDANKHTWHGSA